MHYQPSDSYTIAATLRLDNDLGRLINPHDEHPPMQGWVFGTLKVLAPIFARMYPNISAYYVVVDDNDAQANASVRKVQGENKYLIAVNLIAVEAFANAAIIFSRSFETLLPSELERAIVTAWTQLPEKLPFPNIAAGLYATCALVTFLGHELGHVHEGQFDIHQPISLPALVNHGAEFSADGWAIWTAADLVDKFAEIGRSKTKDESYVAAFDRVQTAIILSAFCCADSIDIGEMWTPINILDKEDTHPKDFARFVSGVVSLVEWWTMRKHRDEDSTLTKVVETTAWILVRLFPVETSGSYVKALEILLARYEESSAYIAAARKHYEDWVKSELLDSNDSE
jgi:hypothetical protein